MGVVVGSSHVVSAAPSSSGGGLLTLCPCSSARSLSWETVLHKLLQCESFPLAAALHQLPQCGSLLWGAVRQEQAASAWVPYGNISPTRKPAPVWAPLSMGLQVLAGACSSAGSPRGHSLLQASSYSGMGSLPQAAGGYLPHRGPAWTAGGQPASPWSSSWAVRENSLLWHFEHLLPILLYWPWYLQSCFSHIVSLHSPNCYFTAVWLSFFFPLLKSVITEVLPALLFCLALSRHRSILDKKLAWYMRRSLQEPNLS